MKATRMKNKLRLFGMMTAFTIVLISFYSINTYASTGESDEGVEETTRETESQMTTEETEETSENAVFYAEDITLSEPETINTGEERTRGYAQGVGSTGNVIITTNDLSGSLEFVPFTTKDGQQFYLLIDYSQSENNVYLLDTVTFNDLAHMAETVTDADGNPIEYTPTVRQTAAQEETTQRATEENTETETAKNKQKSGKENMLGSNALLLAGLAVIIAVAVVGITFYKKKTKKVDEDNDEFDFDSEESDEAEEDDNVFGKSSETQEQQNLFDIDFVNDEKEVSDPESNDGIEFIDDEPEDEQF